MSQPDAVFLHLRETFDFACKHHPDAMEPYIVMLVETTDLDQQMQIMTRGLRETFSIRYHHIDGLPGT